MPRINLLPHRAELRAKRRKLFFIGIGAALGAAAVAVLLSNLVMVGIVGNQVERNDLLKTEIAALDKRIEEILDLELKKERLLARMQIIEQLQRSRPEVVHIFDELVRTLPDGVRLTSVKQTGRRLEIKGDAESNTRVSAFMRNIDKSEWLTKPDLEVVEVRAAGTRQKRDSGPVETGEFAGRSSQFTVYADQVTVTDEGVGP
ncbi:MAG: PilN domain-containing protein [Gammaproteobacteria bacterium]|nr:PilN domain-containing protein [Gammaproteobacteria bacterium]MDH5275670.1 PilN domain-containing protein [Gammaproteobacteria bacterium]